MVADMPVDIRKALVSDAQTQDIPVSEAAARILCDTFKVKHVPPANGLRGHKGNPVRFSPVSDTNPNIVIRGGASLHRKMDIARAKRGGTLRGIVLESLAKHYGIEPVPSIFRQPRQPKETA